MPRKRKPEPEYIVKFIGRECSEEKIIDIFWGILLENINNGTFMNHGNNSEIDKLEENTSNNTADNAVNEDATKTN